MRNEKKDKKSEKNNRSVFKADCGLVHGSVWKRIVEKDDDEFTYYDFSVTRSYKDKNDEWQNGSTFGSADMPRLQIVIAKCFEYMLNVKTIEGEDD